MAGVLQAQLSPQEKFLRNNQIKKVFVYTLSDPSGTKQLSSIRYLNDSGLTIRLIRLKEGKDTSSVSLYKYDSLNRIVSDKYDYDGKIYETSYLYPEPNVKIIIDRSDNKLTATTIKSETKKRREIQYEYAGDKLTRKSKFIKKRYGFKTVYKTFSEKNHRYRRETTGKEYLNEDKNIVRSVLVLYSKVKIVVGGYAKTDDTGKITEDHQKYKTIKHTSKYKSTYEYDSLKLLSKLIQHPLKDYVNRSYHRLGREYSCTVYEYFK
jgi:hypothetical protein